MNRHPQILRITRKAAVVQMSAFSLIELIGAVAIVGFLAALLLPPQIRRIDMATRAHETGHLAAINDALVRHVIRSNSIPNHATWKQAVADWSGIPVSQVATNARRYQRLYFLQDNPTPGLVYTQSSDGTNRPANLRAIMVSVLAGDPLISANCPAPAGGPLPESDFDALWNVPEGERPTAGLWANWNGRGDDFLMQRIDYTPLFHRLVLVNRDSVSPSFTIDGSGAIAVTNIPNNNVGWSSYYLKGSIVGLCDTNGAPMTRYVLTRDVGFVFEEGLWRGEIMGLNTGSSQADEFGNNAASFLASQWYSGAFKGADQQSALVAMYSFMYTYTLWANQCPHFPAHSIPSAEQVPEYMLLQSAAGDAANTGLDQITGTGGLLK